MLEWFGLLSWVRLLGWSWRSSVLKMTSRTQNTGAKKQNTPPLPRHMLASSAGISQVFMNGHGAQTHEVRFNVDLTIAWG